VADSHSALCRAYIFVADMKYREIIADRRKKAGWSYGYVSALDCEGRTIWIADAHRGDGKRFVVCADEILTAFIELKSAIPSQKLEARHSTGAKLRT
jgi:hypothetical protein